MTERRRYYIAHEDFRHNPSDFVFVNKDAALINGRTSGIHEHRVDGLIGTPRLGVPPLREKPQLIVAAESDELLDAYGLGLRFFSSRARDMLAELDPNAFEFAECDAIDGNGVPLPPYWMMDVVRVGAFDEQKSNFSTYADSYPTDPNGARTNSIVQLNEICVSEDTGPDVHAFQILRYRRSFIFDEAIVDRWRQGRFLGLAFTPLQPPTESDKVDEDCFINRPYWTK